MEEIEVFADETVFRNEDNGYTVLVVKSGRTRVSAVGIMPPIAPGEKLKITGEWTEHPVYGKQIKVSSCEIEKPTTLSGIEKYLCSGMIRGIGPATAKLLIKAFGEKTLDVLYAEPEKLMDVPGIGPKRAKMIMESYAEQAQQREAMVFLQSYGVTPNLAVKIFKQYGENVQQVIRQNPYRLVEDIEGVGFRTADKIAASLGIEPDSEYRLSAGVQHTLAEATNGTGHCYLPRGELALYAQRLLGNAPELIEHTIDSLILSRRLIAQMLPGEGEEIVAVYLPQTYHAEVDVARRLREMIDAMPGTMATDLSAQIDELERLEGVTFHPQQRRAIETAVKSGMTVITGGPGTGKTTIIKCIIRLLSVSGEIALAAPTGRAAKRMSELTGMDAQTVHRLLGMSWNDATHQVTYQKSEQEPLEADAVIVDEMSMVDLPLFSALLRALRPGTRLVLVGDADQLPSVGAGNVFSDLIRSGRVETVVLREVFRQAEQSAIIRNAHSVNLGQPPELASNQGDFFFLCRREGERALSTVVELCRSRLPENMKIPAEQIQVLTPTRKGICGTIHLNRCLQEVLNPKTAGKREILWGDRVFREGDRIMQTRNDYDVVWEKADGTVGTGIFNGDVGHITQIDPSSEWMSVEFDGRAALYSVEMLNEVDLAYAQTVHKSQGNEYRCVVLAAMPAAQSLMVRGVLYTAITRAKELLVIVGDDAAVRAMAANDKRQKRYSGLRWRLAHALG